MPKGEMPTGSIVASAFRYGKEVYVPYIDRAEAPTSKYPASAMDMVSLHSQEDLERLETDSWGIPTPSRSSVAGRKRCLGWGALDDALSKGREEGMQDLDMIVMPGVAFDRGFARLGHGKGFYDFFLARYQRALENSSSSGIRMPFLVGLALNEQILPEGQEIPIGLSDWSLDALIVGDKGVFRR
ncbi:MAG: hypothetical protein Q9170_002214 [Blastenia crenularia]